MCPPRLFGCVDGGLGRAAVGRRHDRLNLREDLADVAGHLRHNCARRNCYETGHQSIFDKVLAAIVFQKID
jgi:hypothetical protein